MKQDKPFVVKDDFLADPEKIRELAISGPYSDVEGPDGEIYKRIFLVPSDSFNENISAFLNYPIQQTYSLFRLNYAGENPNNAIHSDANYDKFALVLYLNRPEHCQGGTAFWRHRKTGWEFLPTREQVLSKGQDPARVEREIVESWNDEGAWEQTHLAAMKFNRAIVYPTTAFHSRFPFEAFGNSPENGRLAFCSFFTPC